MEPVLGRLDQIDFCWLYVPKIRLNNDLQFCPTPNVVSSIKVAVSNFVDISHISTRVACSIPPSVIYSKYLSFL